MNPAMTQSERRGQEGVRLFAGKGGGNAAEFGVGGNIWRTIRSDRTEAAAEERAARPLSTGQSFCRGFAKRTTHAGKMTAPSWAAKPVTAG
jgi:hypothetical protein